MTLPSGSTMASNRSGKCPNNIFDTANYIILLIVARQYWFSITQYKLCHALCEMQLSSGGAAAIPTTLMAQLSRNCAQAERLKSSVGCHFLLSLHFSQPHGVGRKNEITHVHDVGRLEERRKCSNVLVYE